MDPNLFNIDMERLFQVLVAIIVLSFFIERALAIVFENRWLVTGVSKKGVKEPIAFTVAFLVCRHWDFDALSVLLVRERTQLWGHILTAAIIAGGSKASVRFFHSVIGAMSTAEKERQAFDKLRTHPAAERTPEATSGIIVNTSAGAKT